MIVKFVQTLFLFMLAAPVVSFAPGGPAVVRVPQEVTTSLQAMDFLATLGISEDLLLPLAAGAVAALGLAAAANGGDDGGGTATSSSSGKNDVKIDYDAAAQFNYLEETPPGTRSLPGYELYKDLYKERSIAEVKIKVLQRQVDSLNGEIAKLTNPME